MTTWIRVCAVSYTHLDVYKRQAQGRDRALAWAGVAAESLSSLSMLRDLRDACVGGLVDEMCIRDRC